MGTSSEKPDTKEVNVGAKKVRRARYVNLETEKRITWGSGRLFVRSGFHGTSMRDVANRVGLRPSSLYRHVKDKQSFYYECSRRSWTRLLDGAIATCDIRRSVKINICLARPYETPLLQSKLKNLALYHRRRITRKQDEYRSLWLSVLYVGSLEVYLSEGHPLGHYWCAQLCRALVRPVRALSRVQIANMFSQWMLQSLRHKF